MTKLRLICVLLASLIVVLGPPAKSQAQEKTLQGQQGVGADQLYTHPVKGFQILLPGDAFLSKGESRLDVSMRSRQGWSVNIQSSDANPQITVGELIGRLEAKYLGNGKPWTRKLSSKNVTTYGRPGFDGTYEGSGMKARVVLLRTTGLDYVIMLIAPKESYRSAQRTFDRILASFKPGALPTGSAKLERPSANTSIPAGNEIELIRFHDTELGFSMVYPSNWKIGRPNQSTTVFSGPPGTEAAFAAVTVQNVAPPVVGPAGLMVDAVIQELRTQMAYSLSHISHVWGKPYTIQSTDGAIQVVHFVSDYRRGDISFRQWTLSMARPGGEIVHVWTYVAPLGKFELYQSMAQQMAGSWTVASTSR